MASWSQGTSLKGSPGAAGDPGAKVIYGAAEPGLTLGAVGDFFYRTDTQTFYTKVTSFSVDVTAQYPRGWRNLGSVTGAVGPTGSVGPAGATGPAGPKGDTGADSTVPGPKGDTGPIGPAGPQGPIGPIGDPGISTLTSQSTGFGPGFVYTAAIGTTPVNGLIPGTQITQTFRPSFGTALMGIVYTNNNTTSPVTLTLLNVTTNTVVFTGTASANVASNLGPFSVNQYQMAPNNSYVWQLTSASANTANLHVHPQYLFPAASNVYNVSSLSTAVLNATFGTTKVVVPTAGTTAGLTVRLQRASSLYQVTVTNTSAGNLTLILQAAGGAALWTQTVPAGSSAVPYGPFPAGQYTLAGGTQYYYTVSGSGTGSLVVDAMLLSTIA